MNKKYILSLVLLLLLSCTSNVPRSVLIRNSKKLIRFKSNGLFGYKTIDGKIVIQPKFIDCSYTFSEDLAFFKDSSGKWGIINKNGKVYADPQYSRPGQFSEGVAVVLKKDQFFIIDLQLNETKISILEPLRKIPYLYRFFFQKDSSFKIIPNIRFSFFREGMCSYSIRSVTKEPRTGFINKKGVVILKPAIRSYYYSSGFSTLEKDGKYYFVNKKGEIVLGPYIYAETFSEGLALICIKALINKSLNLKSPKLHSTKFGYIDRSGKIVIKAKFDEANSFHEGLAAVRINSSIRTLKNRWYITNGGKWGYIDKSGKFVILPKFIYASRFRNGKARVNIGGKEVFSYDFEESGYAIKTKIIGGKWIQINKPASQ